MNKLEQIKELHSRYRAAVLTQPACEEMEAEFALVEAVLPNLHDLLALAVGLQAALAKSDCVENGEILSHDDCLVLRDSLSRLATTPTEGTK